MLKRSVVVAMAVFMTGCGHEAGSQSVEADNAIEADVAMPRFDQQKIASAEAMLRAEPKVVDVLHQEGAMLVDWQVAVRSDGTSRTGYAEYICQQLNSRGLVDGDTDVRIVDVDYLRAHEGAFRDASLGHVRCHDGADVGR